MTGSTPGSLSGPTPSHSDSISASGSQTPANDGNDGKTSPTKRQTTNVLGLGLPELATPSKPMTILSTYPHLGHYVHNLIATAHTSPPRVPSGGQQQQHPLSVSSSGESDDEDSDKGKGEETKTQQEAKDAVDRDALVKKIVDLLDNEEEEQVKDLLRPFMGDLAKDEILMDQVCLDCMHRRKDDIEGTPYAPHLTPSRARASPSLNASHPLRPYAPARVPSFRARTPLGRPQSPVIPSTASGPPTPTMQRTMSSLAREAVPASTPSEKGGSPATSPKLSARASAFNPVPGSRSIPLSSASATFSPSDAWKDAPVDPPRSASPFGAIGAHGMVRTSSNLALFTDRSSPFHSPLGTPNKTSIKMPDVFNSPSDSSSLYRKSIVPDVDDDDEDFSPFATGRTHQNDNGLNLSAKPFEPSFGSADSAASYGSRTSHDSEAPAEEVDMGSGMTPLDVLSSVFSTVPRTDLEDALHRSGYDFEGAMAILVSQFTLPRSGASTPGRVSSPRPALLGIGNRGTLPSAHFAPREGYFTQGGRSFSGHASPGFMTRSPGGHGTRMCRYFLQGECRRADCRFSHDLDRALCRFWLRGHCAKGPNCEFMHHFPNNVDPHALSNAMSRVELSSDGRAATPTDFTPTDEFPDLMNTRLGRGLSRFDPSRNRFANAVKRPVPMANHTVQITGARFAPAQPVHASNAIEQRPLVPTAPRASTRLKLRPPTLLPTLQTGSSANDQYMSTRSTAIRLGHARNACLARASDAFRRGDGAAAKRFSREGRSLNERMLNETFEAAQHLVRERRKAAQQAVRERDPAWSDDPGDRSSRGKECAGGLGVVMGIASSRSVPGGDRLSADERTEILLDLHTLHGTEGTEILSQFLVDLEREAFRGLAYVVVGEEKHVGTQDVGRGASKVRLGSSIKQWLGEWGYAWSETGGVVCVDPAR